MRAGDLPLPQLVLNTTNSAIGYNVALSGSIQMYPANIHLYNGATSPT
jgi:hypothetical protein